MGLFLVDQHKSYTYEDLLQRINATKSYIPLMQRDDIGFTSFDLAELTVRIEDEFDIDIFEDGLVNTVGEIIEKLR
ncbi:acyl carrier protein [Bacteroides fragilis]|nr:acyl carrier protein [Bacteroides fragilis]